ncbi:putative protein dsf2 [Erysiphe neolycopersici]|uniref:Uncharacterized protein n=1 Tax=Erysiphe neolycopersici TaxID=212602 RepID=A0A420I405_9PEZI|nr:putative protein dsf2 [Erysiphe neolycopersici]
MRNKMPLRDRIKNKVIRDKANKGKHTASVPILVLRSDSESAEIIHPPSSPVEKSSHSKFGDNGREKRTKRLLGKLRLEPNIMTSSSNIINQSKPKVSAFRRLSKHLHRRKSKTSEKVPTNLPDIDLITEQVEKSVEKKINEIRSQWERRALLLAKKNEESQKKLSMREGELTINLLSDNDTHDGDMKPASCMITRNQEGDSIQEAIRLHESGELECSTKMFGRLAETPGRSNNLSQVLYGLSLRHGWGCTPDPVKALEYLTAAAANAASVEESALKTGKKMGGLARGELVIAIYELANCFRHGWGLPVDEVAAKQYYETAANLGDTGKCYERSGSVLCQWIWM